MDKNSLAHTSWNCKYHIVFAPKYRRQVIYGELRAEIGQILRKLCEQKGIEIHEELFRRMAGGAETKTSQVSVEE